MSTSADPAGEASEQSRRRVLISEDLPLTMLTAVATTLVMNAVGFERELMYVGVALSPLVADVIKNSVRGLRKRWLLLLTALLALLGSVGRALAARLRARADRVPTWSALVATASLSTILAVAALTAAEVAHGSAFLVNRPTTFFGGGRSQTDVIPPRLHVPPGITMGTAEPSRVAYRVVARDLVDGPVAATCMPRSRSVFALGTTIVRCTATDAAGNRARESFTVTLVRVDSRVRVVVPGPIRVDAAGPHGGRARFDVFATGPHGRALAPRCSSTSGSLFPIGLTVVTCSAVDRAGDRGSGRFHVIVRDDQPPVLSVPGALELTTPDASGRVLAFDVRADDRVDGAIAAKCSPTSGSRFPVGTTTVRCAATDSYGNRATAAFAVTVKIGTPSDVTAPTLTLPPGAVHAEATSSDGAQVSYAASARDGVDGSVAINCAPRAGSLFPLGVTTVHCDAQDAAGNLARGSFRVSVVDTTPPMLILPSDLTKEATSPGGTPVAYSASASDRVDGALTPRCTPPHSSAFPLGRTLVSCSVVDRQGNRATGRFAITVVDTSPPALKLPGDLTVEATSAKGATVQYDASADDRADGRVRPICSPATASAFPLGRTRVSCSTVDRSGNRAQGSFTIAVVDTTPPALKLPGDLTVEATSGKGAAVRYAASAADLVSGTVPTTCSSPSGIFPVGRSTVTCSAVDAAGNRDSGSFVVAVVDTTAPLLTLPSGFTVSAHYESAFRTWVATITYSASANDRVDGTIAPSCSPASGRLVFAASTVTITVQCTAVDAHGNRAAGSFNVTVYVPPPPG